MQMAWINPVRQRLIPRKILLYLEDRIQIACAPYRKNYNVAAINRIVGIKDEKLDADCHTGAEWLRANQ